MWITRVPPPHATAPDPVASSTRLSGSLCAARRGTMRGLFLAPPLPRAATTRAGPVAVLGRSLVLISGVQRKLNAPWLHTEQLSWGFRPPPCKQLCAFRLFFFLNKV